MIISFTSLIFCYTITLPSCCKCNKDKVQTIDRGIQKSTSSCSNVDLSSTKVINRESINVTKYNIPIKNEDFIENRTKKQPEIYNDTIATATGVPLVIPKVFEDKSVQTEWCDVLVRLKRKQTAISRFIIMIFTKK